MSVRSSAVTTGPRTGAVMRLKRNDAPQIAASATRRAASAPLIASFLLDRQQLLLPLQAPGVTAETAIGAHRTMAGHHQRHGVGAARAAYRAHGIGSADGAGDLAIGARLAARDAAQLVPHLALE